MIKDRHFIVANWKMNPTSLREAKVLFGIAKKRANRLKKVKTIICPPSIFLSSLGETKISSSTLVLGGQDAFWLQEGPYTGQVSPEMIKSAGARYIILGHSEKRALGDTDELIQSKIKACLRIGLKVILCIGEKERDDQGEYLKYLTDQLTNSLTGIKKSDLANLLIAYEPLWAIGQGAKGSDTPAEFRHNAIFIKKVLSQLFGQTKGRLVPVLYGGSVNVNNAKSFLLEGEADGLLVGRESLIPSRFGEILKQANL